jgi:hypothetical protein
MHLFSLAMLSGCALHVRPAPEVVDGVQVYVVDYGDTGRLWLSDGDAASNAYTEWCYGDWAWYAHDQQSTPNGMVVLVLPTQGALGRRQHASPPLVSPDVRAQAQSIHGITVERAKADALTKALELRYTSAADTAHFNAARDIWFVKDENDYWLGNQSSTRTGDWLTALGCDVSGFTLIADYRVAAPSRQWKVDAGGVWVETAADPHSVP